MVLESTLVWLSPVQGFKATGRCISHHSPQHSLFSRLLQTLLRFFPLMAPVLTFYPGLLVILTQALSAPPVSRVPTCSTSHHSPCRPWGAHGARFEVKLWHSCLARRHQVIDLAHGSGIYFPWWQLALTHLSWVTLPDTVIPTWQH